MATFNPNNWTPGLDKDKRPCWYNQETQKVVYSFPPGLSAQSDADGTTPNVPTATNFSPASVLDAQKMWKQALASSWTEYRTDNGKTYWFNRMSGTTTWDRPDTEGADPPPLPAQPGEPALPKERKKGQWQQVPMKYRMYDVGRGAGEGAHTPPAALPPSPVPPASGQGEHEVEKSEHGEVDGNDAPPRGEGLDGESKTPGNGNQGPGEEETPQGDPGGTWDSTARKYANEGHSGVDRLGYSVYAEALAGLFNTGETNDLPAAVGIYAPWGGGKSFLLDKLKNLLERPAKPTRFSTWCCCMAGLLNMVAKSVVVVVIAAIGKALLRWCRACQKSCLSDQPQVQPDEESAGGEQDVHAGREFVVVEFNAWEYAGSDVLWASVVTKIFDTVERHPAFGRGAVRAARINKLLEDPSWNWCGLVTFYFVVAALGLIVLLALNWTGVVADTSKSLSWVLATVVPGGLTLLKLLLQMRSRGSLGTAQSVLKKAISRRESVGESYLGFMSDVREELEVVFDMIHTYNNEIERKKESKGWRGRRLFATSNKGNSRVRRELEAKLALTVIVDDLDRCPKKKVMEMLRATHLLLEHPKAPMVVFLAVDPQLIISAIAKSLDGVPNTMKALEYLDKIIHLPFCIPPMSVKKRLNLLENLLNGTDNSCQKTLRRLKKILQWAPGEELNKLMSQHQFREAVGTIPMALELMCYLDHWRGSAELENMLPSPPMAALEKCFNHLRSVGLTESGSACVNVIEEMNKEINKTLAERPILRRQPAPERSSATPRAPRQPPQQPGGPLPDDGKTPVGSASPTAEFRRGVSVEENTTFVDLFEIVQATPRKIKRVVNVYFLQRFLVQDTQWKEQDVENAQELITWTILAEFWPFRVSCVACAMVADASMMEETTIQSLYMGVRDSSVRRWIETHRNEENIKDLYMSDYSEGTFQDALQAGARIPRKKVVGSLLRNSFNLNPAIMSIAKMKMAVNVTSQGGRPPGLGSRPPDGDHPATRGASGSDWRVATTATSMTPAPSDPPVRVASQAPRVFGKPDVDAILAGLDFLGR